MEKLMQYVWQHRLWTAAPLVTTDGEPVDVLDPGLLNTDAGPDFFNAKVRIGNRLWAGNIEIHVRASDWYRHGHDCDHAYDNVVLHVVAKDDAVITRPDGSTVPQVLMPCSSEFRSHYEKLVNHYGPDLACAAEIGNLPEIYVADWMTSLTLERLQAKAARITALADAEGGDWQHAVYVVLARALGFGKNNDAFERLALATPLRRLRKHSDSPVSVQAMLMGQAGFLDNATAETASDALYLERLRAEYRFMARKFDLRQPRDLGWKMARMRPPNFPLRRIAALAQFVCDGFRPGRDILTVTTPAEARSVFDIELNGYWKRRYGFAPPAASSTRAFSVAMLDVLAINVAAPAMYAFGLTYGKDEMMENAAALLQQLPPEQNSIVRLFTATGVKCRDAFSSQALIELRRNYCEPRKCLYCRLGHRFLASKVRPD